MSWSRSQPPAGGDDFISGGEGRDTIFGGAAHLRPVTGVA
ncbi:hypothetical protein [Nannocystis pusilla]